MSFGIGEAEEKFDASLLVREAVEFLDHSLCNLTCLKSADGQSDRRQEGKKYEPSEANFLADTGWCISANLCRDSVVGQEVLGKVLCACSVQ